MLDANDTLHRFHVDFDNGGEADYLVVGEDRDYAISRLRAVLGTNDKIHEAFPAPDGSLGHGVYIVRDLPCPMDRPDSIGQWVWWQNGKTPRIVEVALAGEEFTVKFPNSRPETLNAFLGLYGTGHVFTRLPVIR